uniref:Uncharacterized protein n=1 Tax=Rhizophagus irregularis (strain DAOM 181602 / DAOM 197198 / MUCL 43194) TaxID=747089 RepID=U9UQI7_RHIID
MSLTYFHLLSTSLYSVNHFNHKALSSISGVELQLVSVTTEPYDQFWYQNGFGILIYQTEPFVNFTDQFGKLYRSVLVDLPN